MKIYLCDYCCKMVAVLYVVRTPERDIELCETCWKKMVIESEKEKAFTA